MGVEGSEGAIDATVQDRGLDLEPWKLRASVAWAGAELIPRLPLRWRVPILRRKSGASVRSRAPAVARAPRWPHVAAGVAIGLLERGEEVGGH